MVGSLLRRLGLSKPHSEPDDYEALLSDRRLSFLDTDEDSIMSGHMALHSSQSRAKRPWVFLDATGKISQRRVRPHPIMFALQAICASHNTYDFTCNDWVR